MATNIVADQCVEVLAKDTASPSAIVADQCVEILAKDTAVPNVVVADQCVEVLARDTAMPKAIVTLQYIEALVEVVVPWIDRVSPPDVDSIVASVNTETPTLSGELAPGQSIDFEISGETELESLTVNWTAVEPDTQAYTQYLIYRKRRRGEWELEATSELGATSWTDPNVSVGGIYEYKLKAFRPDIDPEPVTDFGASAEATVLGIDHYDLIRDDETPPESYSYTTIDDDIAVSGDPTSYSDTTTNVKVATTYYFQARADDGNGTQSDWSNVVAITIPVGAFDCSRHVGHTDITGI